MALTTCTECGATVSATASKCPTCGRAAPATSHRSVAVVFVVGCVILFALVAFALLVPAPGH